MIKNNVEYRFETSVESIDNIASLMPTPQKDIDEISTSLSKMFPNSKINFYIHPLVFENGSLTHSCRIGNLSYKKNLQCRLSGNDKMMELVMYYEDAKGKYRLSVAMYQRGVVAPKKFVVNRSINSGYNEGYHSEEWDKTTKELIGFLRKTDIRDMSVKDITFIHNKK